MSFSPEVLRWLVQAVIILVLSVCVHEFGHAFVADRLGDGTPRSQGRVTLNPMAHADPIGTLAFPAIALLLTHGASAGFGWGRPVQIYPPNFTRRWRMRTSHMVVAFAGPIMNLLLGTLLVAVTAILLKQGVLEPPRSTPLPSNLSAALQYAAFLNYVLFFFNLIPAPPLDGGAVLEGLLPDRLVPGYQRFAVYGPFVLMAVILIPGMSRIFVTPALWVFSHVYGLFM